MLTIYLPPVPAEQRKRYMRAALKQHMRLDDWVLLAADQAASGAAVRRGSEQPCCARCKETEALLKRAEARVARLEAEAGDGIQTT